MYDLTVTALATPVFGSMAGYPSLAGRTIFISGGGSGIGASIVERFAQQGSRVAFCDVAEEPAQALVARLAPAPVRYRHCDVRDTECPGDRFPFAWLRGELSRPNRTNFTTETQRHGGPAGIQQGWIGWTGYPNE